MNIYEKNDIVTKKRFETEGLDTIRKTSVREGLQVKKGEKYEFKHETPYLPIPVYPTLNFLGNTFANSKANNCTKNRDCGSSEKCGLVETVDAPHLTLAVRCGDYADCGTEFQYGADKFKVTCYGAGRKVKPGSPYFVSSTRY